ncbi:MAG TPA: hypothetical protein PKU69_02035, partial [Bacillota bacterium]|nr:hypothetical protein [Bacillota bacterium]
MIAKILVDIKSKNVDKTYDYIIPQKIERILEIGARVIVPFGNRNIMGFCLEIAENSDYQNPLKEIVSVLDVESYLTQELIDLAKEMREETSSLLIQILETMLPAALKVVYRPKVTVLDRDSLNANLAKVFEYSDDVLLDSIPTELLEIVKQEIKNQHLKQIYDITPRNKSLAFKYVALTTKEPVDLSSKQMS